MTSAPLTQITKKKKHNTMRRNDRTKYTCRDERASPTQYVYKALWKLSFGAVCGVVGWPAVLDSDARRPGGAHHDGDRGRQAGRQPESSRRPHSAKPTSQSSSHCFHPRDATRHDTKCYFNVRSKADMSQLNLPHGTLC